MADHRSPAPLGVSAVDVYREDCRRFIPIQSVVSTPRIPHPDTPDQTKSRICSSSGPTEDDESRSEVANG